MGLIKNRKNAPTKNDDTDDDASVVEQPAVSPEPPKHEVSKPDPQPEPERPQPKRQLTEKQKEALARGRQKRAELKQQREAEIKALQPKKSDIDTTLEVSSDILNEEPSPPPKAQKKPKNTKRQNKKQKIIFESDEDESSSDEEEQVIIVKKSKKSKDKSKPSITEEVKNPQPLTHQEQPQPKTPLLKFV